MDSICLEYDGGRANIFPQFVQLRVLLASLIYKTGHHYLVYQNILFLIWHWEARNQLAASLFYGLITCQDYNLYQTTGQDWSLTVIRLFIKYSFTQGRFYTVGYRVTQVSGKPVQININIELRNKYLR